MYLYAEDGQGEKIPKRHQVHRRRLCYRLRQGGDGFAASEMSQGEHWAEKRRINVSDVHDCFGNGICL
jgi:hypothetical protein